MRLVIRRRVKKRKAGYEKRESSYLRNRQRQETNKQREARRSRQRGRRKQAETEVLETTRQNDRVEAGKVVVPSYSPMHSLQIEGR